MNKSLTFLAIALFAIPAYLFAAQSQNLESVLLEAASNGQIDMVKAFLDKGANIEIKNDAGATPLIFACVKGHANVVQLLLEWGANVNAGTNTGITPLIAAASAGNEAIVQLLLEKGADVSARDHQGRTALDIAEATGDTQVFALLKLREGTSGMASPPNAPAGPNFAENKLGTWVKPMPNSGKPNDTHSTHATIAQTPVVPVQVAPPPMAQAPATQTPMARVHTESIREADNPSGLTVRSEPSPQGRVMAYLPIGSKVSYLGEPNNGWVKLSEPIAEGWIAARYVGSGGGEASVIKVDNPDQCLRVRKGPGGNYDKIGCLPIGATVKVAGPAQNSWAKIVSPMEGWVSAGQIQGPGVFPAKPAASGVQKARPATSQSASYKRARSDSDSDFDRTSRQVDREMSDVRAQTQSVPMGPQVFPGSGGFGIGPLGIGLGGFR